MDSAKGETDVITSSSSSPVVSSKLCRIDLTLRILLFFKTLAAIIVMVTSKQKKEIFIAHLVLVAKFDHSSAFIYFVVAISVACLYSLVTATRSAVRPNSQPRTLFYLAFFDALIFGVVASAVGAAASIAYVGAKGNANVGWTKICNIFDTFCKHIGASIVLSVSASVTLIFLIIISTYSLYRHSR